MDIMNDINTDEDLQIQVKDIYDKLTSDENKFDNL